jgi:flap endonuclease-1
MGIKYLNKYLQSNCKKSIRQISLHELRDKKIVIDTSIYLYRFLGENALLENFYLMISIFREYNIIPLFIFDGKPPKEKFELLKKRKIDKKNAEMKYNELECKIKDSVGDMDPVEEKEIKDSMEILKKDFIRLHHTDIENVKSLFQAYGVSYIEAPGEADKLCAKMVCKNKAYACLSEDMDLFVYGCSRVLRYMSLLKKTVVMYNMKDILNELNLSMEDFRSICIVSGTDYTIEINNNNNNSNNNNNNNTNGNNLVRTLKYFKKYQKYKKNEDDRFYEWLETNTKHDIDSVMLYTINSLFTLENMIEYKQYEKLKIINGPINKGNLITVMEKENFIFVN